MYPRSNECFSCSMMKMCIYFYFQNYLICVIQICHIPRRLRRWFFFLCFFEKLFPRRVISFRHRGECIQKSNKTIKFFFFESSIMYIFLWFTVLSFGVSARREILLRIKQSDVWLSQGAQIRNCNKPGEREGENNKDSRWLGRVAGPRSREEGEVHAHRTIY